MRRDSMLNVLAVWMVAGLAAGGPSGVASAQAGAEPKPADKAPPPSDTEKKPLSGPAKTAAPSAAPATPDYPVGPDAKIEKKDDGSVLIDDRFVVKGDGTAEKPYEIPWELLVSMQESFAPDKKLKTIPSRVKMLDGKRVRITGNILFPMFVKKPKELLTMLNQWDGCCIGVPPTPYDAIEVKLAQSITDEEKFATQGELEGKFGVKPFLTGDWLVGLYVMEDAKFTVKAMGSPNVPQGGIPPN